MSRLTIELPSELGRGAGATEWSRTNDRGDAVDEATRTFVRWFECWAGRGW